MKFSIAIPTYECFGRGVEFLDFQFKKLKEQTFKDFEVIISDNSQDDEIEFFVKNLKNELDVKYFRNHSNTKNSSSNMNNCIKNCNGDYIKIVFQDDFLFDENSLFLTLDELSSKTEWLVSACLHTKDDGKTFYRKLEPYYNENMQYGNNTISSPSVLTIKNNFEKNLVFDERLTYYMDTDFYKALYDKYGYPKVLSDVTVVNRVWTNQTSSLTPEDVSKKEMLILYQKYGAPKGI